MKNRTLSPSKGDLINLIYSKEELRSIDTATPMNTWEAHPAIYHVMNYNHNTVFGSLQNIFEVAKKRKISLPENNIFPIYYKAQPQTIEQIKTAVNNGKTVHWANENYVVIKDDKCKTYLIHSKCNDHYIGLTNLSGTQLNGNIEDFYIPSTT